jgi:hypothetical protein
MSLLPIGIHSKILNRLVWDLRKQGLWAERHSYSFRIIYNNRFIASFHIYPGYNEVEIRVYGDEADEHVIEVIEKTITDHLPSYMIRVKKIKPVLNL